MKKILREMSSSLMDDAILYLRKKTYRVGLNKNENLQPYNVVASMQSMILEHLWHVVCVGR